MKTTTLYTALWAALFCAAAALGPGISIARAALGEQLAKLTAADAAADDIFGYSVAISGNTALVGARYDDDGGENSGSAYVFDVTTGEQLVKLTASDAAAYDWFGSSVAISGNTALVGTGYHNDTGPCSGSAYLFDVATGDQLAKLTPADAAAYDYFGWSVAISGNTALVGAKYDDDDGSQSGSAYLFDVATGDQLAKLVASDAATEDWFGSSVAINGEMALVGAYGDDDAGSKSGSAYLFNVTTGDQLAKLTASDATADDWFGASVAISGNTALVGAPYDDDDGSKSGSAYLFDISTGKQLAKLTASDATANDQFGWSVAISGSTASVGAQFDGDAGSYSGSAYLFDVTTGEQLAKLTASDAAAEDQFGSSVAISGSTALVGAQFDDDDGSYSGSAYLFSTVPEPGTLALLLTGLATTAALRRRR